jgi:transcriptional accessory protein Tex/SPT6
MNFFNYMQESTSLDQQSITEVIASRFSELLNRGHSVADLLAHFGDEFGHLPAERLRALARDHRLWKIWRKRLGQIIRSLEDAGLPPLPETFFQRAPRPDQLDAIVRTARLCPRDQVADQAAWEAILAAGIVLWTRCLALARKQGSVRCEAVDLESAANDRYDDYVRASEPLAEIASHRWLAMRRGEGEGALALELQLPQEALVEELELHRGKLGPTVVDREPASLLQELVLDDLQPWLLRLIDQEAQDRSIAAAAESLAGLLRSAPVQAHQLAAFHVVRPNTMAAVVVVDRDGDVQTSKSTKAKDDWIDTLCEPIRKRGVQQVVLPASAISSELLTELEQQLIAAELEVIRVRPAALSEARQPLMDPPIRLSASVAAATVLARRALDPLKEWASVDPVNIGVAEYQSDLNQELLRATLAETVELCLLERRRGKRVSMGGGIPHGSSAMARLNPLVKTLNDLRGGMTVHGVVTNISHFGAFVNLGLPQEALVHISELSDQFVENPNEVVSIGQQVTAHVLSVDPPRGRISLSLKNQNRVLLEGMGGGRGGGGGGRPGGGGHVSKSKALADLEKLFKK